MEEAVLLLILLGATSGRNLILPPCLLDSVCMTLFDKVLKEEIDSGKPD